MRNGAGRLLRLGAIGIVSGLIACAPHSSADTLAAQAGPSREPIARQVPRSSAEVRLSFAPVVRQVSPAVVSITSRRATRVTNPFADDPFFRFFFRDFPQLAQPEQRIETSLGSGVIVRDTGLVVTNHHVVGKADEIEVVLQDRRAFPAELISSDATTDIAFLRIDTGGQRLPALQLGDSDALEVGDLVLALGNPFGIGQTVTSGIVSAKERVAPTLDRGVSFIQTDAAINPGNSGGALVTLDGRLIGINTAIFTRSGGSIGIGFAIPSNLVRARLEAVARGETEIQRAWLGIRTQAIDASIAPELGLDRPRGVLVRQVYPSSAADRAGLTPGDVVVAVDGAAVDEPAMLDYRLALKPLGQTAALELLRQGRGARVEVLLEAAPSEPPPRPTRLSGRHPLAGATVANLSPAYNEKLGIDMFERGVAVLEIEPRSLAQQLRLRPGDVVESINGERIATVADLEDLLEQGARVWDLGLRRNGRAITVTVQG
jgi:Do/DeqQ family serine protease